MDPILEALAAKQDELVADSNTIVATADAEKREITADELTTIRANTTEFETLKEQIEVRETILAQNASLTAPQGRMTAPDGEPGGGTPAAPAPAAPVAAVRPGVVAPVAPRGTGAQVLGPRSRLNATHGFTDFGAFTHAVQAASRPNMSPDGRLMAAAASTYGNESVGSDGGFLVPPEFRTAIMEKAFGEDSLISRTDQQVVGGNSLTFPTDMTTPWGTGGIQAYWESEAGAYTQSKPVLQDINVRLNKLTALVPVTEELLDDAPAMGSYVSRKAAEKIDFKVSDAIAYGTGAGQPLGFMNAACLVTESAEVSQVADTIVAANCTKMLSRLPIQSRRTAVWLIHPDAEPQLPLMTIGDHPVYLPPGGLAGNPLGNLLGRPVLPHQVCQTVGDLGDIMLVDLNQYLTALKAGGLRSQTSIHLWFDQDLTAFKFTLRIAGQPWWSEVTTANNGSFTQSPFVTLAARA